MRIPVGPPDADARRCRRTRHLQGRLVAHGSEISASGISPSVVKPFAGDLNLVVARLSAGCCEVLWIVAPCWMGFASLSHDVIRHVRYTTTCAARPERSTANDPHCIARSCSPAEGCRLGPCRIRPRIPQACVPPLATLRGGSDFGVTSMFQHGCSPTSFCSRRSQTPYWGAESLSRESTCRWTVVSSVRMVCRVPSGSVTSWR